MKITARNKKVIWNKLKNFMSSSCSNEKCWIDQTINNTNENKKIKKNYLHQMHQTVGKII